MPVQEQAATMTCSNRASITGVGYELPLREAGITTGVPPVAADRSESEIGWVGPAVVVTAPSDRVTKRLAFCETKMPEMSYEERPKSS